MKKKSLAVNAFLNSIRNILNILFPLITFPYVSRKLNVEGIGTYNFSKSVVSYFLLIAALGINTYAVREGAKYRSDRKKFTRFSSEIFTINMCSTVIAYILLIASLMIFSKLRSYTICILIFSLQIFFTTIGTEWIYQIYEDYTYITIRSIIFQIISIVLLFIFVQGPQDYLRYAEITVFSAVGSNILNFFNVRKYSRLHLIFHFNWKIHMIPILTLFAVTIASMIYVNSDITLLGIMKNSYIVGIYTVSSQVYSVVKTIMSALLIVTIPRLALYLNNKKMREYHKILSELTNTLVFLTLPASVGVFMLSKEIIVILSGKHFLRAIYSLRILCFACIFAILAWILNDCVLIPAKREKYVLQSTTISASINIIFNIIFIPLWDENAAAFSTVIAEMCMFFINYYHAKDLVHDIFISKKFLNNIFSTIVGCMGIVIMCLLCNIGWKSLIFKTIFSIILSVIIYGAILTLFHNQIMLDLLRRMKLEIKNKI